MKVTLKLTDNEIMFIHMELEIEKLNKGFEEEYVFLNGYSAKRIGIDLSDNEYLIQDVDKFREFLFTEDKNLFEDERKKQNTIRGILSKLDDAVVQNNKPKGDIGVWDIKFYREDDEGNQTLYEYNGDCSVFSDMVDEDDLTELK